MRTDRAHDRLIAAWDALAETAEATAQQLARGQADPGQALAALARHGFNRVRDATDVYRACLTRDQRQENAS